MKKLFSSLEDRKRHLEQFFAEKDKNKKKKKKLGRMELSSCLKDAKIIKENVKHIQ